MVKRSLGEYKIKQIPLLKLKLLSVYEHHKRYLWLAPLSYMVHIIKPTDKTIVLPRDSVYSQRKS